MPQLDETAINVFVDGSSKRKPRRGGVGMLVVSVDDDGYEELHPEAFSFSYEGGRNNAMEIEAVIEALKLLISRRSPVDLELFEKIVIYTDSRYVADNYPNALFNWPKRGWRTFDGAPVMNLERWKEVRRLVARLSREHRITVRIDWVKGKSDSYTKLVDQLAKDSAESALRRAGDPERVRRRWSPRAAVRGSIQLTGQEEVVRIVRDQVLRGHAEYHYVYEVIDKSSPHFQGVDYAFSTEMLSAGHLYRVRFNDDADYPRIEKVIVEYPREDYTLADYRQQKVGPWEA